MLFAIADDRVVTVLENELAAHIECEEIDVRNGVYVFFAEDGTLNRPGYVGDSLA